MFIWATLARHAKYARTMRVLLLFFAVQCLLSLPVGVEILRTPPSIFYPRMNGGPDFSQFDRTFPESITIYEDERGFISALMMDEPVEISYRQQYWFIITPEYFFYIDSHAELGVPTHLVPAWVLQEMDLTELFDHLALYNQYFSSIVAPFFLLIFVIFVVSQAVLIAAAVWLFGQWRKLTAVMTLWERFSVCTFASVPAGLIGFVVGLLFPVAHIFIFQLFMIYFAYLAMKEFN